MTNKIQNPLVTSIVEGIQDRKGKGITVLDLRGVDSAIADYYVICEGNSTTQVDSIADSIEDKVRETLREKPHHVEGRTNATWVLVDYYNVIVHIFLHEAREFYSIETLWNDAERTDIADLD